MGIPKWQYGFNLTPRYRFSDRFLLIYGFEYGKTERDLGYVDETDDGEIIFGERDRSSYETTITGTYNFSTLSSLSISFRHNWSKVPYQQFLTLNTTNGLLETSSYAENKDVNFNSWNLDLNYAWQFAPGSQLIALYRNSINPEDDFAPANLSFSENINELFNQKIQHMFSVRFVYFIDYEKIKKLI